MTVRVVFAGTPAFSLNSLEALVRHPGAEVVGVYTQPDRQSGRGRKLSASPISQRAGEFGISVYQPRSFGDAGAIELLSELTPDLMVVTAYGLLLPPAVLSIPRLGCVNVHASLLPRWRGAAPIQRAIEAGDTVTGITLMQMEAGLDTGPMLVAEEVAISAHDTGSTLHDKLAHCGGQLLSARLDDIIEGRLAPVPQNDDEACYASKLNKAEAMIDWSRAAAEIDCQIRAFNPFPVSETTCQGERLRVHMACPVDGVERQGSPGEVVNVNRSGVEVACGSGTLGLQQVQKIGGKPMPVAAWLNGVNLTVGQFLGEN